MLVLVIITGIITSVVTVLVPGGGQVEAVQLCKDVTVVGMYDPEEQVGVKIDIEVLVTVTGGSSIISISVVVEATHDPEEQLDVTTEVE